MMSTERVTIPILAERIEVVKNDVAKVDAKVARVYALQAAILISIIAGIVVALVTR